MSEQVKATIKFLNEIMRLKSKIITEYEIDKLKIKAKQNKGNK